MKDYGNAIKSLRKKNQMTQTTLAEKLNISGQAVSKWENNLAQPDFDTIIKMTTIFGITLDEFSELIESGDAAATHAVAETVVADTEKEAVEEKPVETAKPAPLLIGVCSNCGVSIYDEKNLGSRSPKLLCKNCKAKKDLADLQEAAKRRHEREQTYFEKRKGFLKAMIIPAVVISIIMIIAIISTATQDRINKGVGIGASIGASIAGAILIYLAVAQICMPSEDNFICNVFDLTFRRTFSMPGIIFTLDINGIIWAICVKIGLSILAMLLSVLVSILGFLLCCLLAPFFFPFTVYNEVRDLRVLKSLIYKEIKKTIPNKR